jgi:hypothetical protein
VKVARVIAAGFAILGCFLIFVSVGPQSWPLVLGWLGAALVVGLVWLQLPAGLKLGFAVLLLAACVLLTWEGGLFFVPSALALTVASVRSHRSLPA